jgi:hypothetical protein
MAFGIDDALAAAAAGISLTDTCVQTIKKYQKQGNSLDIERLIEEVRITALQRIDEADVALAQLERTLVEKGVRMDRTLQEAISETSFWEPFEAHRLKSASDAASMPLRTRPIAQQTTSRPSSDAAIRPRRWGLQSSRVLEQSMSCTLGC